MLAVLPVDRGERGAPRAVARRRRRHRREREAGRRSTIWHASRSTYVLDQLALEEGRKVDGSSLLDHSLVAWGNELGVGNSHTYRDIPWVLAGGARRLLEDGASLHEIPDLPHNNLLWSRSATPMGLDDVTTFGIPGVHRAAAGPRGLSPSSPRPPRVARAAAGQAGAGAKEAPGARIRVAPAASATTLLVEGLGEGKCGPCASSVRVLDFRPAPSSPQRPSSGMPIDAVLRRRRGSRPRRSASAGCHDLAERGAADMVLRRGDDERQSAARAARRAEGLEVGYVRPPGLPGTEQQELWNSAGTRPSASLRWPPMRAS